ncbi:unnamed protein product [Diamesa serratosioi]
MSGTKRVVDQITVLRGERPILKDLLQQRLIECGWSDEVRLMCRELIAKESGLITVDNMVDKVTPQARMAIPDTVKKELLHKIKKVLMQEEGNEVEDD